MDFSVAVPLLERTQSAFSDIRSLDLRDVPASTQVKIGDQAGLVRKWLDDVASFSLAGPNPGDQRNVLLDQLESYYDETLSTLTPLVGYLLLKQPGLVEELETTASERLEDINRRALGEVTRLVEEARSQTERIVKEANSQTARQRDIAKATVAETERIVEEADSQTAQQRDIAKATVAETERIVEEARSALKSIQSIAAAETAQQRDIAKATVAETERIVEEARSVLKSIQSIAAEAGVGQQSTVFGDQATNDRSTSEKWLVRACWAGGVSLVAVFVVVFWPLSAETTSEAVRTIGGRLAILTFFAFVLGFTVRQYTSSKHNEMVNLHRANALRTFTTFVGAASDQEMKDAVLLEATRAIFAPQPSGFLRAGHETESPSTIIEVIRRISSGTANKP